MIYLQTENNFIIVLFPWAWKRLLLTFANNNPVCSVTHLLWYGAADPVWRLLMFYFAAFLWHLVAFLVGLIPAFLVRNLLAVGYRDVDAVLDRDLITDWVGDLSLVLLLHVLAVFIWVVCAGGSIRDPFLVISSSFPVVLAVLLIAGAALCLCVGFIFCSELFVAFLLVVSFALLLICGFANLSGGGAALSFVESLALVHVHRGADVLLCLYVGGVPDSCLFCPASD